MSLKIKRIHLEELYFSFSMKLATPKDFQKYIEIKQKFITGTCIQKIDNFFQKNYHSHYRDYVVSILSEDYKNILKYFEDKFLISIKPQELLNLMTNTLIDNQTNIKVDIKILKSIHNQIYLLLKKEEKYSFIPIKLIIYFHLLRLLIWNDNCLIVYFKYFLLKEYLTNYQEVFNRFKELASLFTEDKSIFNQLKKFMNKITKDDEISIYRKYLYFFEFIENKYDSINEKIDKLDTFLFLKNNEDMIHPNIIEIYLYYFSTLFKNDPSNEKLYTMKLFLYFNNNLRPKSESKEQLAEWLMLKIEHYKLQFSILENKAKDDILILINPINYALISEMIIYFSKFKEILYECYSSLKVLQIIINKLAETEQGINVLKIKYLLFYNLLFAKQLKYKKQFSIISNLNLNYDEKSFFCIHCIFIYLHTGLKNCITNQTFNLTNIFLRIENNNPNVNINTLANITETFSSFHDETKYISKQIFEIEDILYEKDTKEIINKYKTNSKAFIEVMQKIKKEKIYSKIFPHLLYCKLPADNSIIFSDQFISNHTFIPIQQELQNQCIQYVLKGFFIIKNDNKKEVILYDRYSLSWYFVVEKKWVSKLKFIPNLKTVYIVYFLKKQKQTFDLLSPWNKNLNEICIFSNEKKEYYSMLLEIFQKNPNIIKQKYKFFETFYQLSKVENFLCFYKKIESSTLNNNYESKQLLMFLINKIENQQDKTLDKIKNEIFDGNNLCDELNIFLNKTESIEYSYDKKEDIIFNLEFCFNHILILENIPDVLIFWMLLLYAWFNASNLKIEKKKDQDKDKDLETIQEKEKEKVNNFYDEWIKQFFKNSSSQKKFKCLSLEVKFNSNFLVNFESHCNSLSLHKEKNYVFLIQILIFFMKYKDFSQFDEIKNYLSALFNKHKYLFFNMAQEVSVDQYLEFGSYQLHKFASQFFNQNLYQQYIKFIAYFTFDDYIQANEFCFSNLKFMIIDDFIKIHTEELNEKFLNKNISHYLIKSRPYCKNIETLLLIEYFLDFYKIEKEKKKLESLNTQIKSHTNQNNNIQLVFPFLILNKKIKKQIQNQHLSSLQYIEDNDIQKVINVLNNNYPNSNIVYKQIETSQNLDSIYSKDVKYNVDIIFIEVTKSKLQNFQNIPQKISSKYFLRGIIIMSPNNKEILIQNKYNNYWFSFTEKTWFMTKENYNPKYKSLKNYILVYFNNNGKSEYNHKLFEIFYDPHKVNNIKYSSQILEWYKNNHYSYYEDKKSLFKKILGKYKKEKNEIIKK